jgi:hypothetical protein
LVVVGDGEGVGRQRLNVVGVVVEDNALPLAVRESMPMANWLAKIVLSGIERRASIAASARFTLCPPINLCYFSCRLNDSVHLFNFA